MRDRITPIPVYLEEQVALQKLIDEAGQSREVVLVSGEWDEPLPYNPDFPNREMALRVAIRSCLLENMGFRRDSLNWPSLSNDEEISMRDKDNKSIDLARLSLDDRQKLLSVIGEPNHGAYKWSQICYWDLGGFQYSRGPISLVKAGVLLFTDEIQKLKQGEDVVTCDLSGFETKGLLMEEKEVFTVLNGNLFLARAYLSD